jgi:hypothetical protein
MTCPRPVPPCKVTGPLAALLANHDGDLDSPCRNQTGYIGVRQRKWGMFAAEIRGAAAVGKRLGVRAGASIRVPADTQSAPHARGCLLARLGPSQHSARDFPSLVSAPRTHAWRRA